MELIAAACIVSVAYVYAPWLRTHTRLGPVRGLLGTPPTLLPGAGVVELPPEIEKWCDAWMDQFARDEAKETARALYAEYGNWDVVLQALERTCQ